ncbi:centriole, cilia and spindle-associated protein [Polymixia lowei]
MVTKKIRTEYMKKFRDPKWETFSKCYEDSLKYRLTRRVMEHSHRPWIWEGWDNGSDSSGRSTPRLTRNKIAPLSVKSSTPLEDRRERLLELKSALDPNPSSESGEPEVEAWEQPDGSPPIENGLNEPDQVSVKEAPNTNGPSDDTATDDGPIDRGSSDEEPVKAEPRHRHRHRAPRSEPGHRDSSHDDKPAPVRKQSRAKSQPPISSKEKENRRLCTRHDRTERHPEVKRTQNESHMTDACVQTRRGSDKRGSAERRRARSADLEKMRKSELTVADDRWMTEYMRCFSARLR